MHAQNNMGADQIDTTSALSAMTRDECNSGQSEGAFLLLLALFEHLYNSIMHYMSQSVCLLF